MVGVLYRVAFAAVLVLAACTTVKNPAYCDRDADCKDSVFPFCDLHGEYPESNHKRHTCTAVPEGCPAERCGCEPGAGLSCDVDQLESCNADGRSSSVTTCALGCSTATPRCLTFEPSNRLGGPLADAAAEPDIVLPAGARIDTDLGLVQDGSGAAIPVRSVVIEQDGGSSIRAFLGQSFVIDDVTVQGGRALAIVAPGPITIRGVVDASAEGSRRGPGGQDAPAPSVAADTGTFVFQGASATWGAAGGGNATQGAPGGGWSGPSTGMRGAAAFAFSPLLGGGRGGHVRDPNGVLTARGGGGGGAIQLVSLESVAITSGGLLLLGGGGGDNSAGGGAGGTLVIEAPRARFDGSATGVVANGGAGGGCGATGPDGTTTTAVAIGPLCADYSAGDGGTVVMSPTGGAYVCPGQLCAIFGDKGGGGGSAGRMLVSTASGNMEVVGSPLFGAHLTNQTLVRR